MDPVEDHLLEKIHALEKRLDLVESQLALHKAAIEFISTCHMNDVVRNKMKDILSGKTQIQWY